MPSVPVIRSPSSCIPSKLTSTLTASIPVSPSSWPRPSATSSSVSGHFTSSKYSLCQQCSVILLAVSIHSAVSKWSCSQQWVVTWSTVSGHSTNSMYSSCKQLVVILSSVSGHFASSKWSVLSLSNTKIRLLLWKRDRSLQVRMSLLWMWLKSWGYLSCYH